MSLLSKKSATATDKPTDVDPSADAPNLSTSDATPDNPVPTGSVGLGKTLEANEIVVHADPIKSGKTLFSWARDENNTGIVLSFSMQSDDATLPYITTDFISDEVLFSGESKVKILDAVLLTVKNMIER